MGPTPATLTKLLMLRFMCSDPNHQAFAVPLANNMEAKHCAGQTLYSIFNKKSIWRAYLMGIHAKTKTLALILLQQHYTTHSGLYKSSLVTDVCGQY